MPLRDEEIAAQIAEDAPRGDARCRRYARRVRRKVGLSQVAFARRIGVPVDTVRDWEQAKWSRPSTRRDDPPGRCCASSTAPRRRLLHALDRA